MRLIEVGEQVEYRFGQPNPASFARPLQKHLYVEHPNVIDVQPSTDISTGTIRGRSHGFSTVRVEYLTAEGAFVTMELEGYRVLSADEIEKLRSAAPRRGRWRSAFKEFRNRKKEFRRR